MLVTVQNRRSFSVLIKNAKNTKKGGQKGIFLGFPGPPNSFMVKKPARLGELIASALSFSSPR